MKILHFLLKLFPISFQKDMGEAWLEASETEIQKRQEKEGKKWPIIIAFAMETVFTVLPQAYKFKDEQNTLSPNDFVPHKSKKIAKIVNFFNNWLIFHLVGMVVALHVIVVSVYPPAWDLLVCWIGLIALMVFVDCKNIGKWWVKSGQPVISLIGGGVAGYYSTFMLFLIVLLPMQIQTSVGDFSAYTELKKQMGYDPHNPTNQWFEDVNGSVILRPEKKDVWCTLSRARLEGASAFMQQGQDNQIRGRLLSQLYSETYYEGCWENEELYIAQRHALAAKSLTTLSSEKIFKAVENAPLFGKIKSAQNYMRTKSMYSPHTYCMEYNAKYYRNRAKTGVTSQTLDNTCRLFMEGASMTPNQARDVRFHSDKYIHALEEQ